MNTLRDTLPPFLYNQIRLALGLESLESAMEKGKEIGAHLLSGAVLDPRALRELLPEFEGDFSEMFPLCSPVRRDTVYFLTEKDSWKLPLHPPFLHNNGNYIVSLNRLGEWLGQKLEAMGATIFTGFSGMELLYEEGRVVGVRTGDKGINRQGEHKSNFQSGHDIFAKVTILAEGPRGSLAKQLLQHRAELASASSAEATRSSAASTASSRSIVSSVASTSPASTVSPSETFTAETSPPTPKLASRRFADSIVPIRSSSSSIAPVEAVAVR